MKLLAFLGLLVLGALLKPAATDGSTQAPTSPKPTTGTTQPSAPTNSITGSTEAPTSPKPTTGTTQPSTTTISTEAPATTDSTAGSTEATTDSTAGSTEATTDSSAGSTEAPAPTNSTAGSTEAPAPTNSTAGSTEAPAPTDSTAVSTEAPAPTNSTASSTEAPAPTDSTVPSSSPITVASPATPVIPVHPSSPLISETNLLLADDNIFVELIGKKTDMLTDLTLVILNAGSSGVVKNVTYDNATNVSFISGVYIYVETIDKTLVKDLTSVVVVLYMPGAYTGESIQLTGMQDFVVLSTGDAALNDSVKEAFLWGDAPPLVSKGLGANLSLSRFENTANDTTAFVVAAETRNATNNISLTQSVTGLTLQLHSEKDDCKGSKYNNTSVQVKLYKRLVAGINGLCRCGLSFRQISGRLQCYQDLFLHFSVKESYLGQGFAATFSAFVQSKVQLTVDNKQYSVVNCTQDCQKNRHIFPPSNNPDKGNIKVTVAVVMSCIVVFLFILIAVIFYMRKKQRGIMRQFRMTRLQEDDDMDDMEDFIGGYDQEPSFSSSRNNLTN